MKNFTLIDRIGSHSGMHYFDLAFIQEGKKRGINFEVFSNFASNSDGIQKAFSNFYTGNKLLKSLKFATFLIKLLYKIRTSKQSTFIYHSFGEWLDFYLLRALSMLGANLIIDVHEIVKLDDSGASSLNSAFMKFYSKTRLSTIVHSVRSEKTLNECGHKGQRFVVPHFRYLFSKNYDRTSIGKDILDAVNEANINILFFGHIRESKGIHQFVDAGKYILDSNPDGTFNFVIAGVDSEGLIDSLGIPLDGFTKFNRYISDGELNYLFSTCRLVILPYREVSQSGVLEVAAYFRKPTITSQLEYFSAFFDKFPSFGRTVDCSNISEFSKNIMIGCEPSNWFSDTDVRNYESSKQLDEFYASLGGGSIN